MTWLIQIHAIAKNTFIEAIRQPAYLTLTSLGCFVVYAQLQLSAFTFDNDDVLMINSGLSIIMLGGFLLSAFIASGVIHREIKLKTALTVISKPVPRPVFILGKYFGILVAIFLAMILWAMILLMISRHGVLSAAWKKADWPVLLCLLIALFGSLGFAGWANYAKGWNFSATITRTATLLVFIGYLFVLHVSSKWELQSTMTDIDPQVFYAIFLTFPASAMLTAIAVALSTRTPQVVTILVTGGFYVLGLLSDHLFGRYASDYIIADIAYRLTPNLQVFWLGDAIADESLTVTIQEHTYAMVEYTGMVTGYALIVTIAWLAIAIALFQKKEAS